MEVRVDFARQFVFNLLRAFNCLSFHEAYISFLSYPFTIKLLGRMVLFHQMLYWGRGLVHTEKLSTILREPFCRIFFLFNIFFHEINFAALELQINCYGPSQYLRYHRSFDGHHMPHDLSEHYKEKRKDLLKLISWILHNTVCGYLWGHIVLKNIDMKSDSLSLGLILQFFFFLSLSLFLFWILY